MLVTGATGFVGAALARELVARGARVRVLCRPTSPLANLEGLAVERVTGDLRQPDTLGPAVAGMRYLFHVAADYRLWVPDAAAMYATNVEGTVALLTAAKRAQVERVVYTSSVATLRVAPDTVAASEEDGLSETEAIGPYKGSKVAAERRAEALERELDLDVVIVNPSTPIGPGDIKPTPTGRVIVQAARGKIPAYVDTGLNLVGVEDVARGHIDALCYGRRGQRYILGGQNVTLAQFLAQIARIVGRPAPSVSLPRAPLYPLALVAEGFGRVTGREPFLTRDALKMSKNRMYFSSAKAERELHYSARPYTEALDRAVHWFRTHGYL